MNKIVKYALIGAVIGTAIGIAMHANAQVSPYITPPQPSTITPYQASPYNYNNSEFNYNNSPYNYNNSPYNYNNSEFNTNSPNRIYDNNGNATGYSTQTPSGVTNYFDFEGNRLGYKPAQ
jgi:hypothetical protein